MTCPRPRRVDGVGADLAVLASEVVAVAVRVDPEEFEHGRCHIHQPGGRLDQALAANPRTGEDERSSRLHNPQ